MFFLKLKTMFFSVIISTLILFLVLSTVGYIWYPNALMTALHIDIFIISILMFNALLISILALLLYNPDRNDLKQNIRLIKFVQLLVFLFAIGYMGYSRPIWLVLNIDLFHVVTQKTVVCESKIICFKKYFQSLSGPVLQISEYSDDQSKLKEQINATKNGVGIEYQPNFYEDYDAKYANKFAYPIAELYKFKWLSKSKVEQKYGKNVTSWLNLKMPTDSLSTVALLSKDGKIVGYELIFKVE